MRILNATKTVELTEPNLDLGSLREDTITIHHDAVIGVEEQGHWNVLREYPSGGRDVEWVVDVEGVEAKEAYDETENIYVYVPYTEAELETRRRESYPFRVSEIIRERYSSDDEYAILRKKLAGMDSNEFYEYHAFCEQCKQRARQELGL